MTFEEQELEAYKEGWGDGFEAGKDKARGLIIKLRDCLAGAADGGWNTDNDAAITEADKFLGKGGV